MHAESAARLAILGSALLFSTGGAAIKATGLDAWQVACYRSGIAAVALLLFLPDTRRRWSGQTALVGAAYGATLVAFVAANKLTTAANAIFLQSTGPLYIVLLAPWLLREPVQRRDLAFMTVLGAALATFVLTGTPAQASAPAPGRGNVLGVLSGVGWALTVTGLRLLGRRPDGSTVALTAATIGNVLTFAGCLPLALAGGAFGLVDAAVVVYLGVFQLGMAYVLLTRALHHLPALQASLLLLLEPALNPVWAWLAHGEVPGRWPIVAGAVILVATALKAWIDSRAMAAATATR